MNGSMLNLDLNPMRTESADREVLKGVNDLTLLEALRVIDTLRRGRDEATVTIDGMESLMNRLLPIWKAKPHLTLLEVIDLIEP